MTEHFEGFVEPTSLKRVTRDDLCGLYFLFKDSEIVYIGSSVNAFGRALTHASVNKDKGGIVIDFDSFAFLKADKSQIRDLEKRFIRHFKPVMNGTHNPAWVNPAKGSKRDTYISAARRGWSANPIKKSARE